MTDDNMPENLEDLLARAALGDELPAGLKARILVDAAALQNARRTTGTVRPRRGWRAPRFSWQSFGGIGGLVAAGCAGFWIGVSPPDALPDPATVLFGTVFSESEENLAEVYAFGWEIDDG